MAIYSKAKFGYIFASIKSTSIQKDLIKGCMSLFAHTFAGITSKTVNNPNNILCLLDKAKKKTVIFLISGWSPYFKKKLLKKAMLYQKSIT